MFDTTHRITLPQGTIHYRDIGAGPVLVFVHGFLVSGTIWREVVDRLPGFRCIVADWPLGSHQEPMVADADVSPLGVAQIVADFLDALGLQDVTLIGNDSGGAISQLVVTKHPARIGRLVLTPCDAFEVFPPKEYAYLKPLARIWGASAVALKTMRRFPRLAASRWGYGRVTNEPLPNEVLNQYIAPAARDRRIRRDMQKLIRGVDPKLTIEAGEALAGWNRPTLVIWTRDGLFPLSLAERLDAVLPDSTLAIVEDAHAFVMIDRPHVVAGHIASFAGQQAAVA